MSEFRSHTHQVIADNVALIGPMIDQRVELNIVLKEGTVAPLFCPSSNVKGRYHGVLASLHLYIGPILLATITNFKFLWCAMLYTCSPGI